jgi:hypothetical protein
MKNDDPDTIIIEGLIEALWTTIGTGCTAIWRQVAEKFYETVEANGGDMSSPEACLESIKDYFLKHNALDDMTYEVKDGEAFIKVTGCGFMPIVEEMDAKNVDEEHSCPFYNTSLMAFEKVTGNMYDWKREREEHGACHAHVKRV